VSSRQEEKEARRRERLEREQAEARVASRRRRLQLVLGGALALAAVAAVVVALLAASTGDGDAEPSQAGSESVAIPAQRVTDLQAAAKAAGCRTRNFPVEGRDHVEGEVTYRTNPPTSGNHNINPAPDGVYEPGNTPAKENYVHTLEHGRVLFQYAPGLPARRVSQLETLFNERDGYHVAVFENNTKMPVEFAATAWLQQLTCPKFNDRVFDAARAFRARYTDKAPEFIP